MSITALTDACQTGDLEAVNQQLRVLEQTCDEDELQRIRDGKVRLCTVSITARMFDAEPIRMDMSDQLYIGLRPMVILRL